MLPDFSDSGNSLDKNSCILPQNTVFCDLDNRRSKSANMTTRRVIEKTIWFGEVQKSS